MKKATAATTATRKLLIVGIFAIGILACSLSAAEPAPKHPNVLFVIFDDLNDCVEGLNGHPDAKTPNLDRLMKRGVTFLNNQCNAPLCSPSRPSMLTGLYPHTARFFGSDDQDTADGKGWSDSPVYSKAKTWVQFFKENGYDVFGTGKIYHQQEERWSDFTDENGVRQYGQRQSFEPYPTDGSGSPKFPGSLVATGYPQQAWRGKLGYFTSMDKFPEFKKPAKNPSGPAGWRVNGKAMHYNSDDDRGLTPDEYSANYVQGLLEKQHDKPFFINMGLHRPHLPLVAPKRNFDRFPADKISLQKIKPDDLEDCAPMLLGDPGTESRHGGFDKYDGVVEHKMLPEFTQAYLACVNFADEQLGQVLDALEKSPYADNTIVVVTSDNGFHLGEKNWLFKFTMWEESCRVPLVIAGPGIAHGKRVESPVSLVDIYPTLLDLSGLPAQPHGPDLPLDGHSLRSLLERPDSEEWAGPDVALTVLANRSANNTEDPVANRPGKTNTTRKEFRGVVNGQIYSVRSKDFRYTLCPDGGEELYDHRNDPNEWTNLAADPNHAEAKADLRQKMEALVGEALGKPLSN